MHTHRKGERDGGRARERENESKIERVRAREREKENGRHTVSTPQSRNKNFTSRFDERLD